MKVYISGPMTGHVDFNFPAFFKAAEVLEKYGHTPLNPATAPKGLDYAHYMDIAFAMVRSSQAIFMLDGWELSKGAVAEHAYAISIGLPVLNVEHRDQQTKVQP